MKDASKLDVRAITLLALSHVTDDLNQSFLPALLPLLRAERGLTYTAASALILAQAISSSVLQPYIGSLADKRPMPWISGVGLLLAGLGAAGVGFAPSFVLIFVSALISGIGVAMFHPEAARFANFASGARKASGMRWFAVGGNVGFAIGPAFATVAIAAYGISGTFVAALPATIMAMLLLREVPRLRTFLPKGERAKALATQPDDWPGFTRLTAFVLVRSTVYLGLVSYIPFYFVSQLKLSTGLADMVLTAFLVAGIGGTIVFGSLADTYGRRIVIDLAMAGTTAGVALLALFVTAPGMPALIAGFVLCAAVGFVLTGTQTPMIVLGQEYLPNRLGVASGVTLGLAVSVGGVFSPVLGLIADHYGGPHSSIVAIVVLALVSTALGLTLPDPKRQRRTAQHALD